MAIKALYRFIVPPVARARAGSLELNCRDMIRNEGALTSKLGSLDDVVES